MAVINPGLIKDTAKAWKGEPTKLSQFRENYPMYDVMSDNELATAMYTKFYEGKMTSGQFTEAIGIEPESGMYRRGYVSNLRNPVSLMAQESMPADMWAVLTGDTAKSRQDRREMNAEPINRDLNEINSILNEHEQKGDTDSREYRNLKQEFDDKTELRNQNAKPAEFSWTAFKAAVAKDPGAMAAELTNIIMADPYLAITPIGWQKAAASAAFKLAKYGRKVQKTGEIVAGATGAAAAGAAVIGPISVFEQLNENGTVDQGRLAAEMGMGALASTTIGAVMGGVSKAVRLKPQAKAQLKADLQGDFGGHLADFMDSLNPGVAKKLKVRLKKVVPKEAAARTKPMVRPKLQKGEMDPELMGLLAAGGVGGAAGFALGGDLEDAAAGTVLGIGGVLAGRRLLSMRKAVAGTYEKQMAAKIRVDHIIDDFEGSVAAGKLHSYRMQQHVNEAVPLEADRNMITLAKQGERVNLNAAQRQVLDDITKFYRDLGKEGQRAKVLGELKALYVNQLWRRTGDKQEDIVRAFRGYSPKSGHAKEQVIPGYKYGIEVLGKEPVTLDIGRLAKIYADDLSRTIANKKLIESLTGEGFIAKGTKENMDWPQINHPQLQGQKIDPEIYTSLKHVFDTSDPGLIGDALIALNYAMKRSLVSMSFFHLNALVESTIFALGHPRDALKLLNGQHPILHMLKHGRAGDNTEMALRSGLTIGMVEDVGSDTFYRVLDDISRAFDDQLKGLGKLPRGYVQMNKYVDKIMWDRYMTGAKLIVWQTKMEHALNRQLGLVKAGKLKRSQMRSEAEIGADVAEFVNDAFGGLNWRRIAAATRNAYYRDAKMAAFSPAGRRNMQLMMFAPDWTIANLRVVVKAIPGVAKNKFVGDLHRAYVARATAFYLTAANAVNYMMSGHFIWENENKTRIDMGDGREMVASKQLMEPVHWITDPGKTALNKMGVLPKTMLEQMFSVKYLNPDGAPPMSKDGSTWSKKFIDRLMHLGSKFVPIGVQQAEQQGLGSGVSGTLGHPIYGQEDEGRQGKKPRRSDKD